MIHWTITAALGATGGGLALMERLASWRLSRRGRARRELVGRLPAGAQVLRLVEWRGREVLIYRHAGGGGGGGGGGLLHAAARPRLQPAAEGACLRWFQAEFA